MITITRHQARRLRGVFRRHVLGIAHRGPVPPLVLCAEGTQLRARYRHAAVAVEAIEPLSSTSDETLTLPLDALADFEGRDDAAVVLEPLAPDRIVVRWTDHGVPQTREYTVPPLDTLIPFPDSPADWTTIPAGLLTTLAEAAATASEDATRYALNCIQLRGGTGVVAATDGHQLLIHGGCGFPWTDAILVRRSPLFASPALPRDRPVRVGRTGTHLGLGVGPWTLLLEIQTGGRFPDLDHVVPDPAAAATRLRLDPEDARFLGQALDRLPGAADQHAPATLELNGRVAIRARGADQVQATELVLARSASTGTPVRLTTNREFLSRALHLGFTELAIMDADSPVVCRDRDLTYCWQTLAKEAAIEPSDDVTRITSTPIIDPRPVRDETAPAPIVNLRPVRAEAALAPGDHAARITSTPPLTPTAVPEDVLPEMRSIVSPSRETPGHDDPAQATIRGTPAPEPRDPASLAALIQEAEAVHQTLTEARARAGRLVMALRRHRRRERLVTTTLASLRALKLQDVAG